MIHPFAIIGIALALGLVIVLIAIGLRNATSGSGAGSGKVSGSSGHPKKLNGPLIRRIIIAIVTLCLLVWLMPGIYHWTMEKYFRHQQESSSASAPRRTPSNSSQSSIPDTPQCPTDVSLEWQPANAPASSSDWPSWVEIPRCHRIVWCNPDENLVCKEREDAGYAEQCRIGSEARDWTPDACRVGTASRVRSQTTKPLEGMVYKFQFIG